MRFESTPPIKQGRFYELALLGKPNFKPETPEPIINDLNNSDSRERTSKLMDYVENYYAQQDAVNPNKWFMKELRTQIIKNLDLKKEDEKKVKIFTTLDTALDRRGVDFFVGYYDSEKKKTIRILGDVTEASQTEKLKRYEGKQPDKIIIFGDVDEKCRKGNEKECFEIMSHYGFQFAEAIKEKIREIRPV